jgi:protein O-GlcNAc transferase
MSKKNISKEIFVKLLNKFNDNKFEMLEKQLKEILKDYNEDYNLLSLIGANNRSLSKLKDAKEAFKKALKLKPNIAESYNNLGLINLDLGELKEAVNNFQLAINLKSNRDDFYNNLGLSYFKMELFDEAKKNFKISLKINKDNYQVHHNFGLLYYFLKNYEKSIKFFKKSFDLNGKNLQALSYIIHLKQKLCEWSDFKLLITKYKDLGIEDGSVPPLLALTFEDNPANQLKRSISWSKKRFNENQSVKNFVKKKEKINIGYFTSDFYDHPVLQLLAGVLCSHDFDKFTISVFSHGKNYESELSSRVVKKIDYFYDINNMSDFECFEFIIKKKLDVAIDLNGHTKNSKTQIFSKRIAPIQINFLGYPGTMGANFYDYLIADRIVINDIQRKFYSENILYMPSSYQPNDNKKKVDDYNTSKIFHGLFEDSFVLGCFNDHHKISDQEFDIWLDILKNTENTILWLIDDNEISKRNMINYSIMRDVNPERLIFAKKVKLSKHLERFRHMNLFLDTFNYNAHTTCSDALYSGVPVITKIGNQFSARVAASLLNSLNMNELITNNNHDYKFKILNLISDKQYYQKTKNNLQNSIKQSPLFDTKKYTFELEKGIQNIFMNRLNGFEDKDIYL